MKLRTFKNLLLPFFWLITLSVSHAQSSTKIAGTVVENQTKGALVGVSVHVKGKVIGTISDAKGNFEFTVNSLPPFTLVVSSVGFQKQEIEIDRERTDLKISMNEEVIVGKEIVVSASRVEESVLQSPVTVERLDIRSIRETPAPSFFDAIRNIKGVDMSSQSLTFSNPNTRGFSSNGNLRMVQLVDGMDNQAPGLNFSVANIAGLSELDVETVELLPGASSALYGPNALNGILLMNSKSPFLYQGVSAYVKTGIMSADNRTKRYSNESESTTPFYDFGVRYAKAFNNKWAVKANLTYMKAKDWQATDYRDQSLGNGFGFEGSRGTNPGYDGVNVYGDPSQQLSSLVGSVLPALAPINPGIAQIYGGVNTLAGYMVAGGLAETQQAAYNKIMSDMYGGRSVTRQGYSERDMVDYNVYSLKTNASLHYRINDNVEALVQGNWGMGSTIYTAADRYNLQNFSIGQYKAEIKGSNFFVRGYTTQENSGDSHAVGLTGMGMNNTWRVVNGNVVTDPTYFATYAATYAGATMPTMLNNVLGALQAGGLPAAIQAYTQTVQGINAQHPTIANGVLNAVGGGQLYAPGTPEFEKQLKEVSSIAIPGNATHVGSKFSEKTAMYHLEGMYNFNKLIDPKIVEIIAGANYRMYNLNSNGTLFYRTPNGDEPRIKEFGGYVQVGKTIAEILKLSASMRYDKNENFKGQVSPRISGVLTVAKDHNFRASFQTGFRIPDTQAQYIDLLTPQARLIGGLPELRDKYFTGASVINAKDGKPYTFTEFKPERVIATEFGYKGLIANSLFIDAYYYSSNYKDFNVGSNLVAVSGPNAGQVFSMPSNYAGDIKTHGFGIGLDYNLPGNFLIGGNLSNNTLKAGGVGLFSNEMNASVLDDGSDIGFNTPKYRYSLSLGNRNIVRSGWGFNMIFRKQDAFIWNSSFVPNQIKFSTNSSTQALIAGFGTLDVQLNKKLTGMKSILKVGGTNILKKQYTTGWGNPTIGAMYYVSLTFDQLLN